MLIFTLVVLVCAVIGLVISQCVLSSQIEDLQSCERNNVSFSYVENHLRDIYKKTKELQVVNAEVFGIIAKELGQEFTKKHVIKDAGGWDEKIVTKFELVDLPKVKKTK